MRTGLILSAGLLTFAAGCGGQRSLNAGYMLAGAVPPGAPGKLTFVGADVSYSGPSCGAAGAGYAEDSGESMTLVYAHYDLGERFSGIFGITGLGAGGMPGLLLSLRPTIGYWRWSQSPEDSGVMLGFRTGLKARLGVKARTSAILEIGWHKFFDTDGDEDTEVRTMVLALAVNIG